MLIILPPSETKRSAPDGGRPFAFDELSFPTLTPMRKRIVDALVETSARPDALERLRVGPSLIGEVARNTDLRELPAGPPLEIYAGPLYEGLDATSLSAASSARAKKDIVIASSLWGALRPSDRIPAYRLDVCSRLVGLDRLEPTWRTVLPAVLGDAAGASGVVLDLRSAGYQAIGKPAGMSDRTVTIRVLPEAGDRTIGDVVAKRIRGQLAHYLLESEADPASPDELAELVGQRWPVRLDPPHAGQSWTIRIRPRD